MAFRSPFTSPDRLQRPWLAFLEPMRACGGLGFLVPFAALVAIQLGHLGEHVAQMVQIHLLDRTPAEARGVVGQPDLEWTHFLWNVGVLVAVLALLRPAPRNAWLWLTVLVAGWHTAEHAVILFAHLRDGVMGDPGLLAKGGRIAGGLSLRRPELHFLYNVIETAPLVVAYLVEVSRVRRQAFGRVAPA